MSPALPLLRSIPFDLDVSLDFGRNIRKKSPEKKSQKNQNSPVDRVRQLLERPVRQVDVVDVGRAPHLRLGVVDLPLDRGAVVDDLDDDRRLVPAADVLVAVLLGGVAREGAAPGVVDCVELDLRDGREKEKRGRKKR